jgi:hypothetical protein
LLLVSIVRGVIQQVELSVSASVYHYTVKYVRSGTGQALTLAKRSVQLHCILTLYCINGVSQYSFPRPGREHIYSANCTMTHLHIELNPVLPPCPAIRTAAAVAYNSSVHSDVPIQKLEQLLAIPSPQIGTAVQGGRKARARRAEPHVP